MSMNKTKFILRNDDKITIGNIFGTKSNPDMVIVRSVEDKSLNVKIIDMLHFKKIISSYMNQNRKYVVTNNRFAEISRSPNLYEKKESDDYIYTEDEIGQTRVEYFRKINKEPILNSIRKMKKMEMQELKLEKGIDIIDVETDTLIDLNYQEEYIRLQKCDIASKLLEMQQKDVNDLLQHISKNTCEELVKHINLFCEENEPDFHPGSNDMIRDVVHPSLYPYVQGETTTKWVASAKRYLLPKKEQEGFEDIWKRPYEKSKFQWLPSEVYVNKEGKCTITTYINNLPKSEYKLHNAIEKLLTECWPGLENQWKAVCDTVLFDDEDAIDNVDAHDGVTCDSSKPLRDTHCQVITKIVDINIPSNETIEGAWHVEGMSHEHIVCTSDCVILQENVQAELLFKRRFLLEEADGKNEKYSYHGNHCVEEIEFLENGLIPLGKCSTKAQDIVCFPNSHIHKVTQHNPTGNPGRRILVVFWLINPNKRILSTRDVARQQGDMSKEKALKYRLELMEERKRQKETFNIRDINLCEH